MSKERLAVPFVTVLTLLLPLAGAARADTESLEAEVRQRAKDVEAELIALRRDIHQHPELGDQERRTAGLVAKYLRDLKLDVRTGVARTGVVGILKGGKPGRIVALRADMDALPVKEPAGLPFASKEMGNYHGKMVPVMHACGHDTHTAMLLATAKVLASIKDDLPGTVMFIFQPAEEGSSLFDPTSGQSWGAKLMMEQGLFKDIKPDAIFALHVMPSRSGEIAYRTGATTASGDDLEITITGKQGHGGMPWNTVDSIVTSASIISGLQTVVSRKANLIESPLVVTIGTINGGTASNIVAETVKMTGTIRAYDEKVRQQAHRDIRLTVEKIAESAGAKAAVSITKNYDTTINNEHLAAQMAPVLKRAADGKVTTSPLVGASEDFSVYAREMPGLFIFLGITPVDQDPAKAAPNHSPDFFVDESALVVGTRTLASLAVNFLGEAPKK
ncbi:MAG: amidohydrolase [Planctomycetes bacterium]|nr:amidohydrolase [Planctomycetota bacterium]